VLFCLSSILAGACGNLIERIKLHYVTDFLAFNIFGYDFPNFNFADICITVGCFAMLIYVIFIHKKDKPLFRQGTFADRFLGE
jgi:signal peptidase II